MNKLTQEQVDAVCEHFRESGRDVAVEVLESAIRLLRRDFGPKPEPDKPTIFEDKGRWFRRTGDTDSAAWPLDTWYDGGGDPVQIVGHTGLRDGSNERLDLLPEIVAGQKWKYHVNGTPLCSVDPIRTVKIVDKKEGIWAICSCGIHVNYKSIAKWYCNHTILPTCPSCGEQYDPEAGHDCKPATFEAGDIVECIFGFTPYAVGDTAAVQSVTASCGASIRYCDHMDLVTFSKHFRLVRKGGKA